MPFFGAKAAFSFNFTKHKAETQKQLKTSGRTSTIRDKNNVADARQVVVELLRQAHEEDAVATAVAVGGAIAE
jgi:Holliday junction resolvase RusA-like endonuclease